MSTTLKATFATRRDAEMAVERLVQEEGVERTDIFIAAEGDENSAGEEAAGSDAQAGAPTSPERGDAPLNGPILVSVDLQEDDRVAHVRAALAAFDARNVSQD